MKWTEIVNGKELKQLFSECILCFKLDFESVNLTNHGTEQKNITALKINCFSQQMNYYYFSFKLARESCLGDK